MPFWVTFSIVSVAGDARNSDESPMRMHFHDYLCSRPESGFLGGIHRTAVILQVSTILKSVVGLGCRHVQAALPAVDGKNSKIPLPECKFATVKIPEQEGFHACRNSPGVQYPNS